MKTKKTFKAVIAMALALILSLGAMSAAFAANDSITWTVYDETVSCTYNSALALGKNTVAIKEGGYYYFDLSALENGYYSVEITDSVFEYFCVPRSQATNMLAGATAKTSSAMMLTVSFSTAMKKQMLQSWALTVQLKR